LPEEDGKVILWTLKEFKHGIRLVKTKGQYPEGMVLGTLRVWSYKYDTTEFFCAFLE